jgi:hypothetical protein
MRQVGPLGCTTLMAPQRDYLINLIKIFSQTSDLIGEFDQPSQSANC